LKIGRRDGIMRLVARPKPIHDLFSVPAGTVPQQDAEYGESGPLFPPEVFEKHQGKWVALKGMKLIAVRDTEEELRAKFGPQRLGVEFFHVPRDSDILIL
jgi:hypothetical protein